MESGIVVVVVEDGDGDGDEDDDDDGLMGEDKDIDAAGKVEGIEVPTIGPLD